MSDDEERREAILIRDHVVAGVGLQRVVGRLIIEPGRARFESSDEARVIATGSVSVTRTLLAPLGANTDVILGDVVLREGRRSALKIVQALRCAGIEVNVRRRLV